jgi:hypothetical protein
MWNITGAEAFLGVVSRRHWVFCSISRPGRAFSAAKVVAALRRAAKPPFFPHATLTQPGVPCPSMRTAALRPGECHGQVEHCFRPDHCDSGHLHIGGAAAVPGTQVTDEQDWPRSGQPSSAGAERPKLNIASYRRLAPLLFGGCDACVTPTRDPPGQLAAGHH